MSMPASIRARGRLLAWVLLCAAGVTAPAGGSEGGPDVDARAWGATPPPHTHVSDSSPLVEGPREEHSGPPHPPEGVLVTPRDGVPSRLLRAC